VGKITLAEPIEASDDAEAIAKAGEKHRRTLKCEVWQGRRLVAALDAHDLS
jgi:hypothetical protein